jgi:glycosyltransferase involved in cell wall biosynthesis
LRQMPALLEELLTTYRFTSVASHLGLELGGLTFPSNGADPATDSPWRQLPDPKGPLAVACSTTSAGPTPVTIVVPCFNETQSLRYLGNTLQSVAKALRDQYAFTFIFVDDGSTDDTWPLLQELFGARPDCRLVRHERNRGVAHSIQSGIRHAETEVVCSIDCDCTYDPHQLGRMIPLLTDGVDLVTASPYHPEGRVRNVARWRLLLSKSLSQLYRLVLHQKLFTYTSCFRVYRRETAIGISVQRGGFFGITEMLGHLDLKGCRIVEFPATLDVRMLGRSKMKILRTIAGHLGLLAQLVGLRMRARRPGAPSLLRTARSAHE